MTLHDAEQFEAQRIYNTDFDSLAEIHRINCVRRAAERYAKAKWKEAMNTFEIEMAECLLQGSKELLEKGDKLGHVFKVMGQHMKDQPFPKPEFKP